MANPTKSLNRSLSWHQLLDLLGAKHQGIALPATVACPLCRIGVATIYADHLAGGQWFFCPACSQACDMIELASQVWKLPIPTTVMKLQRQGLLQPLDNEGLTVANYVAGHVEYRQRLESLWEQSRTQFVRTSGGLERLIFQYNLRCDVSPERWQTGPGQLLGGNHMTEIERCFSPGSMKHAEGRGRKHNPSEHRVFSGPDWEDVLVVPFRDLPERICSFMFLGRDGSPQKDMVFRRANFGFRGNQHCCDPLDAGLAFHPELPAVSNDWDRQVFAFGGPIVALQLQMRHFQQNLHPLPIAIWHDSLRWPKPYCATRRVRTINVWQMFADRQLIFWMPKFSVPTLLQAIETKGMISTIGPRGKGPQKLKEFIWKFTPTKLLQHIQNTARPWPKSLARLTKKMTSSQAEQFYQRLQLEGVDVEDVLRQCGWRTRNRVLPLLTAAGKRSITFHGMVVIEKENRWYVIGPKTRQEALLSEAVIRIETVLVHRRLDKTYYQGHVLYQDQKIPFCVPSEEFNKDPLRWIRQLLLKRGAGYLRYDPKFSKYALDIATWFQEPRVSRAVDAVGWDDEQQRFVLPRFAIGSRGEVEPIKNVLFVDSPPGKCLERPREISPEEVQRASADDEHAPLFWAIMACLTANILAPAYNRSPCGIGLLGPGAEAMGEAITSAIGCVGHTVNNIHDVRRLLAAETVHHWPIHVSQPGSLRLPARHLLLQGTNEEDDRNIVTPLSWWEAQAKAVRGGWHLITGKTQVTIAEDLRELAQVLLPAFLQHVCSHRFAQDEWGNTSDCFLARVLRNLARFVEERGGDAHAVLSAEEMLMPDNAQGNAEALVALLSGYLRLGKLKIVPERQHCRTPSLVEMLTVDGLLLKPETLRRLMKQVAVDPPELLHLQHTLVQANALLEQRDEGLVFRSEWFFETQRRVEVADGKLLQVVG